MKWKFGTIPNLVAVLAKGRSVGVRGGVRALADGRLLNIAQVLGNGFAFVGIHPPYGVSTRSRGKCHLQKGRGKVSDKAVVFYATLGRGMDDGVTEIKTFRRWGLGGDRLPGKWWELGAKHRRGDVLV